MWGEDAPRTAVGTLHSHLSLLRRALGDADLLRRDGPGYVLDVPSGSVDAAAFELLTGRARDALATDPTLARDTAEWALTLWRGPAYADVADTEWGRAAAVHLDELRLVAMQIRFDAQIELGRHDDVIAELDRAVDDHPMHERFTAQLMLSLYRSGRQVEALRTFDRTRERLVEELGLEPGPELLRLQSAILGHDDWLSAPDRRGTGPAHRSPHSSAAPPEAPCRPATGVARAAPRCRAAPPRPAVRRAGGRAGRAPRVLGGGTRRAAPDDHRHRRRRRREDPAGQPVRRGGAPRGRHRDVGPGHHRGDRPVRADRRGPPAVLRTVSPEAQHRVVEGRDALALLVPDLAEIVPGVQIVRPEVGTERYVLFETVADLLEAESAVWPLVFVLDDLHLTDELSLRMLDHVLRHERPAHVLLVATARTGPQTSSPHLEEFCANLHRDGFLDRLTVGGLEPGDVAELLAAGGWDGGPGAQAIHRATGGNPFFVTELAHHGAAPDEALPDSIRTVLDARLDRLDDQTTRLVALAAVAGPDAAIPVLARAGGFSGDEVLDCVDAAIGEGVLTEDGPTGSVTFPHALVQQAVLERLSRSRRGALHLAIADGLAESGDATRAELAHHLLSAGPLAPRDTVAQAALDAGRDALDVLAYEDADRWALRAHRGRGLGGPGGAAVRRAAAALGFPTGPRQPRRCARGGVRGGRRRDGRRPTRSSWPGRPKGSRSRGRGSASTSAPRTQGSTRSSRRRSARCPPTRRATAPDSSAPACRTPRPTATPPAWTGSATSSRTCPTPRPTPSWWPPCTWRGAWPSGGSAPSTSGWPTTGPRAGAARRAHNASLELNALLYGITDLTEAGLISEAAEWFERFRTRAADVRQPVYDAFVLFIDATLTLLQGDYEKSTRLVDAAPRARPQEPREQRRARVGRPHVRPGLGPGPPRVAAPRPRGHGGTRGPADLGHRPRRVGPGRRADRTGRTPRWPRSSTTRCTSATTRCGSPRWASSWRWRGRWATPSAARSSSASSTPYEGRIGISGLGRVSIGPVARFSGVAALVTGQYERADRLFDLSAKQCRELAAVPVLARNHHDWATVKSALGDEGAAVRLADRARELADRVGMVLGDLTVTAAATH